MKKIFLSIVIPVYNERENIVKTLGEIKKYITIPHEILIVYDFDEDTTLTALKHIKKPNNLFLIKNTVAKGPSGAIRTGMKKAKGSFVLVTMADLCDDLSQVDDLLDIASENVAIVCPSRYCRGGKQYLKRSLKVWAPRSAGLLLKVLAGIPTVDPTNSFKLYSTHMLKKLALTSTKSFSITLEIVVKAHALGYKIVEIPTVWKDRQHGKTHFQFWRSLAPYFKWFCFAIINRFS